jgi:hypothetical protein
LLHGVVELQVQHLWATVILQASRQHTEQDLDGSVRALLEGSDGGVAVGSTTVVKGAHQQHWNLLPTVLVVRLGEVWQMELGLVGTVDDDAHILGRLQGCLFTDAVVHLLLGESPLAMCLELSAQTGPRIRVVRLLQSLFQPDTLRALAERVLTGQTQFRARGVSAPHLQEVASGQRLLQLV